MSADWQALLSLPEMLGPYYGHTPPPEDSCGPFYVHFDERGDSVTLGFETRVLPASGREELNPGDFDVVEFLLVFSRVEGVRITGWDDVAARSIALKRVEGDFEVTLGTPESGIGFRSPDVRLGRVRAYLSGAL